MTPHPHHLSYRPALDGVRAVAVVAVMLFHGGVGAAAGGFLGVDVFFVLSGYLITTLLVIEGERTGRIDLLGFYRRRVRRLMPALLLVLLAVAALPLVGGIDEWPSLRGDGIASLLYVPNWHFVFNDQSYFDQFASPSPLRHMWSLGIEEQWYLLWPAVVLLAVRRRVGRRALAAAALALAAASATWMSVLSQPGVDPSRAYYGTDTRAQALLVGAALAFALPATTRTRSRAARRAVGLAGAGDLVGGVALFGVASDADAWLYEGGFALTAVLAAVVVAAVSVDDASGIARILGSRPAAAVGRVSYGLYLWHWPVFVVMTPARTGITGPALLAGRLAVTLALTLLSYRMVEQPIRSSRGRRLAVPAAAAMIAVAAAFLLPGRAVLPQDRLVTLASAATGPVVMPPSEPPPVASSQSAPRRVSVVGDSVALTLALNFDPVAHAGTTVDTRAMLGCGVMPGNPIINGRPFPTNEACDGWREQWRQAVEGDPDVAVVMLGAWEVVDQRIEGRVVKVGSAEAAAYLAEQLRSGLDVLGDRPVVVTTAPCYREESRNLGAAESPRNDDARVAWVNGVIRSVASERANVAVADLHEVLCPGGGPRLEIDGQVLRYDGVHFTKRGASLVWDWLLPVVDEAADRGAQVVTATRSPSSV